MPAIGGGTWIGAGDADDFQVETSGKTAQRTATSDAGTLLGRYVVASGTSALTNTRVQVNFKMSAVAALGAARQGF